MKIRKVIDICKRSGSILLFEGEREQWISDGHAIYSMFNLPCFDEDSLCKTYDITDKQKKKIIFRHEMDLPSMFDFTDVIRNESMVQSGPMYIVEGGRNLIPYTASQGVVFVDAKYLQPFADEGTDLLQLYERQTEDGQIYFVVKTGFVLVGIITPVDAINDTFVERLKDLAKACDIALFNKRSTERAISEGGEQRSLFDETEGDGQ